MPQEHTLAGEPWQSWSPTMVTHHAERTQLRAVPRYAAIWGSQTPVCQHPFSKVDDRVDEIRCSRVHHALLRHEAGTGSRGESVSAGSGGSGAAAATTAGALDARIGSTVMVPVSARQRASSVDMRSS